MTDEERSVAGYKRFCSIREKLEKGATFKASSSASFFADQIPRFNARHEKTYVSKRQHKWLVDIDKSGLRNGRKSK